MLHPCVFLVKNSIMLYQSMVTLCLVSNLLCHTFDVMHIEKNMLKNIFNTIIDVKGKTKDNIKAKLDIALLCNCKNMKLVFDGYELQNQEQALC